MGVLLGQLGQGAVGGVPIPGIGKMRRSAGHALQVQVVVAQLAAIQSQGFQNGKWHAHPFKKCPFGGPFAPFAGGLGIGGDAAANAAAHGAGTLHHQRANGHVEGGAHAARAVAAHHACSAAIPAAWRCF